MAEDLVKGTLGLGISFTYGILFTTFPLPFVLELVGVTGTDVSPVTQLYFLEACSNAFFFISLFSCCNCAMTKWAFFNCSCNSMIRLYFSLGKHVSVKTFGYSLGACDFFMEGIIFASDLVTSLRGAVTSYGENWSFFPLFLSC
jgi:hypothetical protein